LPLSLRRGTANVIRPWSLWALADVEFNAVTFTQVVNPLTLDRALVEEVLLTRLVLDEPKTLIYT